MNNRNFEKLNSRVEFEMRISQHTSVPNFSQFGELRFWGPNLPKKNFREEY